MYGITYNNKHSFNDLGITILNTRVIEAPSKIKVTETVPFSNITYDFSNLYGGNCYTERKLEYEFLLKANNSKELELKRIEVENWLLSTSSKTELFDDNLEDYYYLAECESVEFEDLNNIGKLKAYFVAYPFRISKKYEESTLWDSFNFEKDILQITKLEVNREAEININNPSICEVMANMVCDNDITVVVGNIEYKLKAGNHKNLFELKIGMNNIKLKGFANVEFLIRKEVL